MFPLVEGLYRQWGGSLPVPKNFEERKRVVEETIRIAARLRNFQLDFTVTLNKDPLVMHTWSNVGTVIIPAIYYFNESDFPENLRADSKIKNMVSLQQFSNLISEKAGLKKLKVCKEDVLNLKEYLEIIKQPEKAKKSLIFCLTHEFAHLAHNDSSKALVLNKWMRIIDRLTLGIFKYLAERHFFHENEKRADDYACYSIEACRGGVYFFKCLRRVKKELRKENLKNRLTINPWGDLWQLNKYWPSNFSRTKKCRRLSQGITPDP